MSLKEQWKKEFEGLEANHRFHKIMEDQYKDLVKSTEATLKQQKSELNRHTKRKREFKIQIGRFWTRKNQQLYNKRQFVKRNPGKALALMESSA